MLAPTPIRCAIVCHLASGLTSTWSKRGRVDWMDPEKAEATAARRPLSLLLHPTGYALPHYNLFGSASILGHVDAVVRYEAVPEPAWRAAIHHTRPGAGVRR